MLAGVDVKWCHCGQQFLKKLNSKLPYDPEIPLLDVYARELTTYVYVKTCTHMFIAALFIIAKKWKQPKCPSTDKWINKIWYIHTMEYYSDIETNKVLVHAITWINLDNILLSERSQTQKATYCMIPFF